MTMEARNVWIETELTNDHLIIFYVKGKSNLLEGPGLTASLLFIRRGYSCTKLGGLKCHVVMTVPDTIDTRHRKWIYYYYFKAQYDFT